MLKGHRSGVLLLVPLACAYGMIMLHLSGSFLNHPDGVAPYHLFQAEALLEGRLELGNSISQLHPGLAWHDGRVQQVWGLGVALWLVPFQGIWRMFVGQWFPDRLALGGAFAFLAFYVGCTGLRWCKIGKAKLAIGFVWLMLLNPPLWTLARAAQLIFEETVLYGILLSSGILVALIRLVSFRSRVDFWLCCILSGLAGLVRPTLGIYGLSGMIICCLIDYFHLRNVKRVLLGACIVISGMGALAVTNWHRFGAPLEFGHSLTLSSESMIYITRFGNPYEKTSICSATEELFSLLFLSPSIGSHNALDGNVFNHQSPAIRWRRIDFTTFDFTYLLLVLVAVAGLLLKRVKYLRKEYEDINGEGLIIAFSAWFSFSFLGLFIFYLYYPSISSRYLTDFLPAILAALLVSWCVILNWLRKLAIFGLAAWLIHGIAIARVLTPMLGAEEPANIEEFSTPSLSSFEGNYSPDLHPSQTAIALNGSGWEMQSGIADSIITVAVDQPQFLELHVGKRWRDDNSQEAADVYRATIDGEPLLLKEQIPEGDGFKVVFSVPPAIQQKNQDQLAFICFTKTYGSDDRSSKRFLYSMRWR